MLVKVSVNVVVSVYALFVRGFVDVFKIFDIKGCKVFSI